MDALQSKAMLTDVAQEASRLSLDAFLNMGGVTARAEVLAVIPPVIATYSEGAAVLAADYFLDERAAQGVSGPYAAKLFLSDRSQQIERALLKAVKWKDDGLLVATVESEVMRPFRDTIVWNRSADPVCVGYRRVARGESCQFCYMLADKGAIFREDTAYFAAHDKCRCTAQPVFQGGIKGPEASALQYVAAGRKRSPAEKERLRAYLNTNFPRDEREFWAELPAY